MKTIMSQAEWILALQKGDLLAFNELFDRYGKRLYYFSIRYLKSAEEAEEIVQ
jgi:RNA polymerase sigma-70 factor (ECF subfamily)